jgi:hypothetical protein
MNFRLLLNVLKAKAIVSQAFGKEKGNFNEKHPDEISSSGFFRLWVCG